MLVHLSPGFLRILRRDRAERGSLLEVQYQVTNLWGAYYNQILMASEPYPKQVDILCAAAISVKFELERQFAFKELGYDVTCACVLYDPFELHVDIAPTDKHSLALIPSIRTH